MHYREYNSECCINCEVKHSSLIIHWKSCWDVFV